MINGKKLVFAQIQLNLYIKLVVNTFPSLSFIEYGIDLLNVMLLILIIFSLLKKKYPKSIEFIVIMVMTLLAYCVIQFLVDTPSIILFLWGIRNKFRFLIVFIAACIFLNISDFQKLFKCLFFCLVVNLFVISIQYAMGMGRDYLGGTFGIEKNCNSATNVFLCVMVIYGLLGRFYNLVKTKYTIIIMFISIYWAALSELKIFYIEMLLILLLCVVLVRGRLGVKVRWIVVVTILFGVGAAALFIAFPEQLVYIINPKSIIWYIQNVHGGAYGFGRTTAISIINSTFFRNDPFKIIFGIGIGNAEFMNISGKMITSEFYNKYSEYSYFGYFHSSIYIELGMIGLIWYFIFWLKGLQIAKKIRSINISTKIWSEYAIVFSVIVVINALKDSTLLISTSGYLNSIFMAFPFIVLKYNYKKC